MHTIKLGTAISRSQYIQDRVGLIAGLTVDDAVGKIVPMNNNGKTGPYKQSDLQYDTKRGFIIAPMNSSTPHKTGVTNKRKSQMLSVGKTPAKNNSAMPAAQVISPHVQQTEARPKRRRNVVDYSEDKTVNEEICAKDDREEIATASYQTFDSPGNFDLMSNKDPECSEVSRLQELGDTVDSIESRYVVNSKYHVKDDAPFAIKIIAENGASEITFPMKNGQLKKGLQPLLAASSSSPFGRGQETVHDTTVRDARQLLPDTFELVNFDPNTCGIVEQVRNALVPDAGQVIIMVYL
jgi:hypothetical protein